VCGESQEEKTGVIEIENENIPPSCYPCFVESEEGRKAKGIHVSETPTQKDVDEHMLTHIPFRSWCKFCVMGRGVSLQHRKIDKSQETIPTISIDYAFLNEKQEVENEERCGMPILAIKDRKTGMMQSRVVPSKGNDKYAIKRLKKDIELLGYKKIILKSDNEPSIISLKQAVKDSMNVEIILEESPVGDHQANGEVENAIKRCAGQFRTLKEVTETRYGKRIAPEHHILPWMIAYSSGCINRFQVGEDGYTNHKRWKGKDFDRPICEFGECIIALRLDSRGKTKSKVRWFNGVFLGIREESGELIVGTPEGIVKARDFKRHGSLVERWNLDQFNNFKGVPWETIPGHEAEEIRSHILLPPPPGPLIAHPPQSQSIHPPRRMRLSQDDVIRTGITPGCPGCLDIAAGRGGMRGSATHNEDCRTRVEGYLRRTGNKRIAEYDASITQRLARYGERRSTMKGEHVSLKLFQLQGKTSQRAILIMQAAAVAISLQFSLTHL